MLYVGCGGCGSVVPLWCAGQFMPHVPMPAVGTPIGIGCSVCGPMAPVFTCTICYATQGMYIPGSSFTPPNALLGASGAPIAPVVQAQPNVGEGAVKQLLGEAASGFAKQFGKGLAEACLGTWSEGSVDSW